MYQPLSELRLGAALQQLCYGSLPWHARRTSRDRMVRSNGRKLAHFFELSDSVSRRTARAAWVSQAVSAANQLQRLMGSVTWNDFHDAYSFSEKGLCGMSSRYDDYSSRSDRCECHRSAFSLPDTRTFC